MTDQPTPAATDRSDPWRALLDAAQTAAHAGDTEALEDTMRRAYNRGIANGAARTIKIADQARSERDQALAELEEVYRDRDHMLAAWRQKTAELETALAALDDARRGRAEAVDRALELAAELEQTRARLNRLIAAAPHADHAHRQLRAIREARAHTCDNHCDEGGCDFDLSGFVDRVDAILATSPGGRCPTCQQPYLLAHHDHLAAVAKTLADESDRILGPAPEAAHG